MFKIYDLLLYSILIILFSAIFLLIAKVPSNKGNYVEVYENSNLVYRYKLTKEKKEYVLKSKLGNETLVIEDFKYYKKNASCRNKTCLHQKGENIICLPNKQVIKSSLKEELDFIIR